MPTDEMLLAWKKRAEQAEADLAVAVEALRAHRLADTDLREPPMTELFRNQEAIIDAVRARARRAEKENEKLREWVEGKFDRYNRVGDAVLPRGWTIVDGGRLDELERAEADLATTRSVLFDNVNMLADAMEALGRIANWNPRDKSPSQVAREALSRLTHNEEPGPDG